MTFKYSLKTTIGPMMSLLSAQMHIGPCMQRHGLHSLVCMKPTSTESLQCMFATVANISNTAACHCYTVSINEHGSSHDV